MVKFALKLELECVDGTFFVVEPGFFIPDCQGPRIVPVRKDTPSVFTRELVIDVIQNRYR